MLTMKTIMSQIQGGDWFVTIDLKDAYFHIQVVQRHRKFLRFAFGGKAYQYKVLPFGLALAPRTFTKCMDAALAPLRFQGIRVLNYLDDWLILAHSRELVSRHRDIVPLPHSFSWPQNERQEECAPPISANRVFWVVHLDSIQMQARLAPARLSNCTAMSGPLQARPSCLCRYLPEAARPHGSGLSCVAPRVASHEAVPLVDERAEVTPHYTSHSPYQCVAQLLSTPFTMAGPRFSPERGQNGCNPPSPYNHDGRINDGLGRGLRRQTGERGMDRRVPSWHINCLELRAVFLALMYFLSVLGEHHIIVRTLNMAVVSHINRQGGSTFAHPGQACAPSSPLVPGQVPFLRADHVPGILNLRTIFCRDQKLRPGEWMLNVRRYPRFGICFGKVEVDPLCFSESSQCPLWFFLSFPTTLGIDAFATCGRMSFCTRLRQ